MGRSRAVSRSADEDHHTHCHSKSKRRKTVAASNVESSVDIPPSRACTWEKTGGGGLVALYHCNYCNKDISGTVRLKCAICPDFDLCVECFSVGAEVTPHKSNHPYRVMDNLSFPLICPDWNADEEILLLEGIEMYGFGNWPEVAEHLGTKTKSQCIYHYNAIYMDSPYFPLPDLSHVMGKSREELLAMAKVHAIDKGIPSHGKLMPKEESSLPTQIKNEVPAKEIHVHHSSFFQESQADRSIGEKKPRVSGEEGPSMLELSGYNFNRQEFEIEYDNDAEHMLADMEFKHTDTGAEHDLKLRVLRIYSKRLDERKCRKNFILERNLLHPDPFEKSLLPEEKEIYRRFKVFMRFHSKEEHEALMKCVIEEHRISKRIQDLQGARAAGCQTAAEARRFIEDREREAEERRLKENIQAGKVLQWPHHLKSEDEGSHRGDLKGPSLLLGNQDSSLCAEKAAVPVFHDDWDITGLPGADLISESEKQLCCEMRILPSHYLKMLQTLTQEILKGTITKKPDAHHLFKVDPNKVDKLYDMLVQKGIAQLG